MKNQDLTNTNSLNNFVYSNQMRKRGGHPGTEREPAAQLHPVRSGTAGEPGHAVQEATARLLLIGSFLFKTSSILVCKFTCSTTNRRSDTAPIPPFARIACGLEQPPFTRATQQRREHNHTTRRTMYIVTVSSRTFVSVSEYQPNRTIRLTSSPPSQSSFK